MSHTALAQSFSFLVDPFGGEQQEDDQGGEQDEDDDVDDEQQDVLMEDQTFVALDVYAAEGNGGESFFCHPNIVVIQAPI